MPKLLIVCLIFLCIVLPAKATESSLPQVFLWAWQRSEDLSTIDPSEFGVAYLACHAVLSADTVSEHWRDQPLKVPAQAVLVPVLRIDVDRRHPAQLTSEQNCKLQSLIGRLSALPRTALVQIDFDALASERPFYRQLLQAVHEKFPDTRISMTALASWCLFDNWISDLPVNERVPMLFSLGRERSKILLYFREHGDFLVSGCCKSLGLSLEDTEVNQLMIPLTKQRKIPVRVYVFTRRPWNKDKIQAVHSLLSEP